MECNAVGGGVKLGVRVWYPVKVLHIRYDLFAGTETLSLSVFTVYETITKRIKWVWGTSPPIEGWVKLGVVCGTM
jgi:hypothetical protein